jgi:hypothetical protein
VIFAKAELLHRVQAIVSYLKMAPAFCSSDTAAEVVAIEAALRGMQVEVAMAIDSFMANQYDMFNRPKTQTTDVHGLSGQWGARHNRFLPNRPQHPALPARKGEGG